MGFFSTVGRQIGNILGGPRVSKCSGYDVIEDIPTGKTSCPQDGLLVSFEDSGGRMTSANPRGAYKHKGKWYITKQENARRAGTAPIPAWAPDPVPRIVGTFITPGVATFSPGVAPARPAVIGNFGVGRGPRDVSGLGLRQLNLDRGGAIAKQQPNYWRIIMAVVVAALIATAIYLLMRKR